MTTFDLTVEDDCFTTRRDAAHAVFDAFQRQGETPNFNRFVYVRMAYLKGIFTEWPEDRVSDRA